MAIVDMKTMKFENDENTYKVVDGEAVHITNQYLSDVEKTQVLNNIGAAAAGHSHTPAAIGAAGAQHLHHTELLQPSCIELIPITDNDKHGGYIDFHYNKSSSDYTSRIIEDTDGKIAINQEAGKALVTNAIQGNAIICSSTQPTGTTAGQLWLKPI